MTNVKSPLTKITHTNKINFTGETTWNKVNITYKSVLMSQIGSRYLY